MWQNKLKEIIYILENSNVNEIDVNFWGRRYRVVKSAGVSIGASQQIGAISDSALQASSAKEGELAASKANGDEFLSPMPGTFYSAPSPDSDTFIKVGDSVNKGDTLCIIEAMKIMNEIEAEQNGIITKIIIENGSPVEYNQPLFLIDPA